MGAQLELLPLERAGHLEYHVAKHQGRVEDRDAGFGLRYESAVDPDRPAAFAGF
jgi:hypothetical protein